MNRHHCLAVCAPGVEEVCAAEIAGRGVRIRRTLRGGVEFSATEREVYAANAWTRTANRVVVRVATFRATTFEELVAGAETVPWDEWIADGTSPVVRVSATSSRLYHTEAIAERVARVAGRGPEPGLLVVARLIHDRVTLSVDASGEPLFRRGWRQATAKAPLRETLAAAMLMGAGWDRTSPLVDPFCGSGTVAVEAALMAAGRAPGEGRAFAFERWPRFQPGTWASVKADMEKMARPPGPSPESRALIVARDRDAGAIAATVANAGRAGVLGALDVSQAPVSDLAVPDGGPGWVVTNPPYGKRVGGADLRDLYDRFGAVTRDRLPGWRVAMLVADPAVVARWGMRFGEAFRTENGGIPVRLLVSAQGSGT